MEVPRTDDGRFHLHPAPVLGDKTPDERITLDEETNSFQGLAGVCTAGRFLRFAFFLGRLRRHGYFKKKAYI
ncbi:hypothetical protein K9F62_13410 [Desulfovibrio sp. JY]|nr:hypothetical protein K9F62_13410 [Desulfovibrio sp. JY]